MSDTTFTAEQIKALTTVSYWQVRRCSMCYVGIGYQFHPAREMVAFDSSCDCTRLDGWQPSSWQDVADLINMQQPAVQERMINELKGISSA